MVIFFSDNGYLCGEKNHWEKGVLWEEADLVPLAIRLPGDRNGGKLVQQPVSLVDLYPTLVDYCNLSNPMQKLSGDDLRPLLEDPNAHNTPVNHPVETSLGKENASVRGDTYRLIVYKDGSKELYDEKTDPWEFHNLAKNSQYSEIISNLSRYIPKSWYRQFNGHPY